MLYNFAPPRSGPLVKRRKVRRACDFCRQHRVRCDGALPCSQCVTNRVKCVKPKALHLPSPPRSASAEHIRSSLPPSLTSCTPPSQSVSASAPICSPQDPTHVVARDPDCLTGFISRINTFCSVVSQMSAQSSPVSDESLSSETSYSTPDLLQNAEQSFPQSNISNSEDLQQRLLKIFWARYQCLAPIVSQTDVLDSELGRKRESLRDALMAYCLQSVYHAGLHHRLLGVNITLVEAQERSSEKQQSPLVAMFAAFFQKALATNSQFLLYAEPSVSDIQRHILMALFLLNSGEVLAAYNITGVAVRLAQSLDLQNPPASQVSSKEAELRGRVWWMLVHLDFRCSRYLGKPVIVSLRDTTLYIPSYNPSNDLALSELAFHSAAIMLTVVGKKIAESLAARHDTMSPNDSIGQIEVSAEHLTQEISRLYEWRNLIVKTEPFRDLVLIGSVNRPQTHPVEEGLKHDDDTWMFHQSPTRVLQQTLLELQFHDLVIWFHRPFIQFPSLGLVPQRSPGADIHATTAIQHALTAIETVHRRMLNHDSLYGCSDVYQHVWNAVLTLVGFMLAYPLCHWFSIARQHVELSLQVFDTAKTSNPIASRAAHLTRYLLGRVDALTELLNAQASTSHTHCHSPNGERAAENWDRVDLEEQSSGFSTLTPGAGDLWSWANTVDPETWSGYCHEINDMLVDLPEIPSGIDHFPQ
ncbi:uncharacterized protein N7479_001111 [Penicillium vulpinum]|uniref:Zn(2)-C6 fungal-type domain-containing protein n=1 Tax=Penicillium vulpinum TaxID=29845 RepID=A0A1V6REK1_9EURO|nr:uncharacterized protein N7479_001111 [Penicillium vulpinum]KAJ5971193.1 hypothetical protein N7479_001111 [Penicillium vulpinum]OQE00222.1 hypothetical protein PENVUL_c056G03187 [Penicillium vulpinum]